LAVYSVVVRLLPMLALERLLPSRLKRLPGLPAPLMLQPVLELDLLGPVQLMPLDLAASVVLRPDLALLEPVLAVPQVPARRVYPTSPGLELGYSVAPLAWRARPLPGEQPVVFQACLEEGQPLPEQRLISWVLRHHQPSAPEP
jgi:hypothetical protein